MKITRVEIREQQTQSGMRYEQAGICIDGMWFYTDVHGDEGKLQRIADRAGVELLDHRKRL